MTIDVISGVCAIRVGKYWVGVIEGNRYCVPNRRTAQEAVRDAKALLKEANKGLRKK